MLSREIVIYIQVQSLKNMNFINARAWLDNEQSLVSNILYLCKHLNGMYMNLFRKFHFLSITFILFTFLSFSRDAPQALTLSEQSTSKGDIKFTLLHSISSEFLLPSIERTQNIQILPILKCFTESPSFSEFQKTLPASESINHIPIVSFASNSILLEQICKLQI